MYFTLVQLLSVPVVLVCVTYLSTYVPYVDMFLVPTLKGKKFVPLKDNDLLIKLVGGDARDITLKFPDVDSLKDWTKAINEHIEYYSR